MHFYSVGRVAWVKPPVQEFLQKQSIAKTGLLKEKPVMFAILVFHLMMDFLNIHELDAASNNSVDDIRALVEQVSLHHRRVNTKYI